MVTLKLTLKSKRPSIVYALNGKAYRLMPGRNALQLEYEDYVSLAKALGIKYAANNDNKESSKQTSDKKEANTEDVAPVKEPVSEEHKQEESKSEEPKSEEQVHNEQTSEEPAPEESKHEEPAHEEQKSEEPVKDDVADQKEPDYSSWSYTQLKAEYKAITGSTCKMKKAEVIQFLQEHNANV